MATVEQAVAPAEEILTPELEAYIRKWKPVPGNLIMVLHKVRSILATCRGRWRFMWRSS